MNVKVVTNILFLVIFSTQIFAQNSSEVGEKAIQKAETHVINGALAEMKEEYAEAILEYQDALAIDPQPGVHFAISKCYLRVHKLPLALKHARVAAYSDSENAEYLNLLGSIYSSTNQIDSAIVIYQEVIKTDSTELAAYYRLGVLFEKDKPLQALEVYTKLLKITGPEWNILVKVADLNERMGNVDETIRIMEELVALNPSNLQLQKLLIEAYLSNENYNKAITAIDDLSPMYPEDLELVEARAKALIFSEQWEKGTQEYKKIIHSEEVTFEGKLRIASAFVATSMQDSTLSPLAKELLYEINKDSVDWQVNGMLSEILAREKEDSLAIEHLKIAAELAEWNSDIWVRLGIMLFEAGHFPEAVIEMEKGLEKFPNDYVMNFVTGFSLSQLNDHTEAAKYLQKAVTMNPNDPNSLSVYAFTLQQLQQEDEALRYVQKALTLDPENSQLLGMAGMIYDNKKMWTECDDAYERALAIDSTDALVNNNFAYSLSERGERLEQALEMVKISIEFDSTNSSYLDTIGWIYFRLAIYDKAEHFIIKAIEADSTNSTQYEHLGDIYFKTGENDKAFEAWEKALELDKENEEIQSKLSRGNIEK